MNYLAHAKLSFNNPEVLAGNMISDYVKGKTQYDYKPAVQVGIRLHRSIDQFTDEHSATRQMMQFFRPYYRLYAGAFVDVSCDYFLANDTTEFENEAAIQNFTGEVYGTLKNFENIFPAKFGIMYPYMISQDWLYHYRFDEGIQKSFNGLVRRAAYLQESDIAFDIFLRNKDALRQQYQIFYPELKQFAAHKLDTLLKA